MGNNGARPCAFPADTTNMTDATHAAIHEYAAKLNKDAASIAHIHFGVWTVGGTLLGMLLGGEAGATQLLSAGTSALICGVIGWSVGQSRSASLRLQAITVLKSAGSDRV
jgi:hypothetical protein